MPRLSSFATVAVAVAVVAATGCSQASSNSELNPIPPSAAPIVTSPLVGAPSPKPKPSPTDTLTGFGATRSTWIAAHGGVDHGPFSGVQFETGRGQVVYSYTQDFKAMPQSNALAIVAALFPRDVTVIRAKRVGRACYGAIFKSATLRREAPRDGPYASAYLYTGFANGTYNPQRVNNAIVITSKADHFPAC